MEISKMRGRDARKIHCTESKQTTIRKRWVGCMGALHRITQTKGFTRCHVLSGFLPSSEYI